MELVIGKDGAQRPSHLTSCPGLLGQGEWCSDDQAWSSIMLDVFYSRVHDLRRTHFSDV